MNRTEGPRLAVSAGIWRGNRVLLIKRGHEPLKDHWTFPGGHVERGERVRDAVIREVAEEVGLDVEVVGEPILHELIFRNSAGEVIGHHVLLVHAARTLDDRQPVAASDAAAAEFVDPDTLGGRLLTQGLKGFIAGTAARLQLVRPEGRGVDK